MRCWISRSVRLRISTTPGRGGKASVSRKRRHFPRPPMRWGMRARNTSSAERGEFGNTTAVLNCSARSRRPTLHALSSVANVSTASRLGCPRHRSASFAGVRSVMCAAGRAARRRCRAGVVITASPSQLTPRTRIFSTPSAMFRNGSLPPAPPAGPAPSPSW